MKRIVVDVDVADRGGVKFYLGEQFQYEKNMSGVVRMIKWLVPPQPSRSKPENPPPYPTVVEKPSDFAKDTFIFTMWNETGGVLETLGHTKDIQVRDIVMQIGNTALSSDDQKRLKDGIHQGRAGRPVPGVKDSALCIAAVRFDEKTESIHVVGFIITKRTWDIREDDIFIKHRGPWQHPLRWHAI